MTNVSLGRGACPPSLMLVRHGQSVGNVVNDDAQQRGLGRLELDYRDADTPLSDHGRQQAEAVARWVAELPREQRPEVFVASPYQRAADTGRAVVEALGVELVYDERLRERDLGILDGFTGTGIRAEFPDEAERRHRVGKFYYRPPGGESWCDVVLRVRSVLGDVGRVLPDRRVCIFSHQAVIMGFRYVLEDLDEETILRIDRETPMPNCSVTTYFRDDDALQLERYADTTAVDASAAPTTREDDKADRAAL